MPEVAILFRARTWVLKVTVDVEAVVDQIGGVRHIVTVDGMVPVPSLSLSRSQSLSR